MGWRVFEILGIYFRKNKKVEQEISSMGEEKMIYCLEFFDFTKNGYNLAENTYVVFGWVILL